MFGRSKTNRFSNPLGNLDVPGPGAYSIDMSNRIHGGVISNGTDRFGQNDKENYQSIENDRMPFGILKSINSLDPMKPKNKLDKTLSTLEEELVEERNNKQALIRTIHSLESENQRYVLKHEEDARVMKQLEKQLQEEEKNWKSSKTRLESTWKITLERKKKEYEENKKNLGSLENTIESMKRHEQQQETLICHLKRESAKLMEEINFKNCYLSELSMDRTEKEKNVQELENKVQQLEKKVEEQQVCLMSLQPFPERERQLLQSMKIMEHELDQLSQEKQKASLEKHKASLEIKRLLQVIETTTETHETTTETHENTVKQLEKAKAELIQRQKQLYEQKQLHEQVLKEKENDFQAKLSQNSEHLDLLYNKKEQSFQMEIQSLTEELQLHEKMKKEFIKQLDLLGKQVQQGNETIQSMSMEMEQKSEKLVSLEKYYQDLFKEKEIKFLTMETGQVNLNSKIQRLNEQLVQKTQCIAQFQLERENESKKNELIQKEFKEQEEKRRTEMNNRNERIVELSMKLEKQSAQMTSQKETLEEKLLIQEDLYQQIKQELSKKEEKLDFMDKETLGLLKENEELLQSEIQKNKFLSKELEEIKLLHKKEIQQLKENFSQHQNQAAHLSVQVDSRVEDLKASLTSSLLQRQSALSQLEEIKIKEEKVQRNYELVCGKTMEYETENAQLKSTLEDQRIEIQRLGEECSKLAGHHNIKQRIHHVQSVKAECNRLRQENSKLEQDILSCQHVMERIYSLSNSQDSSDMETNIRLQEAEVLNNFRWTDILGSHCGNVMKAISFGLDQEKQLHEVKNKMEAELIMIKKEIDQVMKLVLSEEEESQNDIQYTFKKIKVFIQNLSKKNQDLSFQINLLQNTCKLQEDLQNMIELTRSL